MVGMDMHPRWVGLVFVMPDGSKTAIEIQDPGHVNINLTATVVRSMEGWSWPADQEVEIYVRGHGYRSHWKAGEDAAPEVPVAEIERGPLELEP